MIRLEEVCKSYRVRNGGFHTILDNVTFTLPPRTRLGVLGANGAGKTALLRLIAGGEMPDRGRIIREARVSFPVGFTGAFHPLLSGRENTTFLANIYGVDPGETLAWIEDFAELGQYFDMPLGTYSSGMFARLAMATSFAFDFDVYLVDEAIETGDARFRKKCAAAFGIRMKEASLMLVSHNMETIRQYCDVAAVLYAGKLHPFASIDEALTFYEETLRRQEIAR